MDFKSSFFVVFAIVTACAYTSTGCEVGTPAADGGVEVDGATGNSGVEDGDGAGDAGGPGDGGANPSCGDRECGPDGQGGVCGTCINDCTGEPDESFCHDGICAHACCPYCGDRECGDDGCAGLCGVCQDGQICIPDGLCADCTPDCEGKYCGDDDSCGGMCTACPNAGETCNTTTFICE